MMMLAGNNGWHLWGESGFGGGLWSWIGMAILAWLIWANWD